jgi:predicted component of viral defense system (DUF524 family)
LIILDLDLRKVSVKFHKDMYEQINIIAQKNGDSMSETIRQLVGKSLTERVTEKNVDIIAKVVRQQLDDVLKPPVKRLAALSSKCGHMAATAAFLNVEALMELVPKENRRNVREMYNNARKKAFEYMRTKADDWDEIAEINDKF